MRRDGTVVFNIPLVNTGTVSAELGNFVLAGGGTISGIASAASGAVLQFGSNFTITDGTQFVGAGLVQFNNSTSTTFSGTITNNSNLLLNSTGSFTDFVLNGNVIFSGTGVLSLVAADRIRGSGIFINAGTTIEGETSNSGSLGADEIGIVNQVGGVISANASGLTLVVDPNATNGLVNQGTMEAVNGGILLLSGNGGGTFTNSGTIKASGGTLQFGGDVTSSGAVDVGADTLSVTGSYTQSARNVSPRRRKCHLDDDNGFRRRSGRRVGNNKRRDHEQRQLATGARRHWPLREWKAHLARVLPTHLPIRRSHSGQRVWTS